MKQKLLFVFFMLFVLAATAQKRTISLDDESSGNPQLKSLGVNPFSSQKEVRQARPFVANKALKSSVTIDAGDVITLNLFGDKHYSAIVDVIDTDINGVLTITAHLTKYPMGYCIIATSQDGYTSVFVDNPEEGEVITTEINKADNMAYLLDIDRKKMAFPKIGDDILDSKSLVKKAINVQNDPETTNRLKAAAAKSPNDPAVIDLMIIYDPSATEYCKKTGKVLNNEIAQIIAQSNLVLKNSRTGVTFRLVYSGEVDFKKEYPDNTSNSLHTDLVNYDYLTEEEKKQSLKKIYGLKSQHGSDLVLILDQDYPGGVSTGLWDPEGEPRYAYCISNIDGATLYYFAIHELGHNMGADHHAEQFTQPGPMLFDYSSGWRWADKFGKMYCTIMTYDFGEQFSDGLDATRVPYFSNPSVYYYGIPTGHPTLADNARTIRETKHLIAAYMDTKALTCPSPANLSVSDIDSDEAWVNWEKGATVKYYTIEYKISGTARWAAVNVHADSSHFKLSNLRMNTSYQCRIKNNCIWGGIGVSSEITFKTHETKSCYPNYEPNETITSAYSISTNKSYFAGIGSATDQDYYKFEIEEHSDITVSLKGLKKDYNLYLFDAAGKVIGKSLQSGTRNEQITIKALAPGVYYVQVVGNRGQFDLLSCYELHVAASLVCNLPTVPFNDAQGKYFYAAGANNVLFEVNRANNMQSYSVEYRVKGTTDWLIAVASSTDKLFKLSGLNPKTTYQLRLRGTCTPTINSRYLEFEVTTWDKSDYAYNNYEPNNSMENAYNVELHDDSFDNRASSNIQGLMEVAGDEDFYKFEITEYSDINITYNYQKAMGTTISLLDSKGSIVLSGKSRVTSNFWSDPYGIEKSMLAPGKYFIRISGNKKDFDINWTYILNISLMSSCRAPRLMLNEASSKPDQLLINILRDNTTGYKVEYRAKGSEGWINVPVSIRTSSFAISGLTPNTTYQVRAMGPCSRYLSSSYREYEFTTKLAHPSVNNYEPNESFAAAYPLTVNNSYEAGIGNNKDQDYYKFTLNALSNVSIYLKDLPKDYNMALYNGQNKLIGYSTARGNTNETIVRNSLLAGTYYILVNGAYGSYDLEAPYTLELVSSVTSKILQDETNGEQQGNNAIALYPNPVEHTLYIKGLISKEGETSVSVRIFNQGGKLMKTLAVDIEDASIDVSSFSPGVYFLHIDGKTYKFIKK